MRVRKKAVLIGMICVAIGISVALFCSFVGKDKDNKYKADTGKTEETGKEDTPNADKLMEEYVEFEEKYYIEPEIKVDEVRYEIIEGVFKQYVGEESPWFVNYNKIYIEEYVELDDCIILYGRNERTSSKEIKNVWIAKLDKEGNKVWDKLIENDKNENVIDIVVDDEIIYLLTGVLDVDAGSLYANLLQINMDGQLNNRVVTNLKGANEMFQYKNGLYVKHSYDDQDMISRLKNDGKSEMIFENESKDLGYDIIDILVYNDKMYISANEVNLGEYKDLSGFVDSYENPNYAKDSNIYMDEKQRNAFMNQHRAYLFVYDEDMKCKELKIEENLLASGIGVNEEEQLLWHVNSIEKGKILPMTSVGGIYTLEFVYEYVFDETGNLLSNDRLEYAIKCYRR